MTTSQQTSLLYEIRQKPIPKPTLVELEARFQHRVHSMILDAFNKSGLSQKELAERLDWDESRISRLLSSASNLTLATISALLAAIGVDLDDPSYTSFDELERRLKASDIKVIGGPSPKMPIDLNNPFSAISNLIAEYQTPSIQIELSGMVKGSEIISPSVGEKVVSVPMYRERPSGENLPLGIGEYHAR
jgi:transcriptional regulator with XRE-family HTH domain